MVWDTVRIPDDMRKDYGERRRQVYGLIGDRLNVAICDWIRMFLYGSNSKDLAGRPASMPRVAASWRRTEFIGFAAENREFPLAAPHKSCHSPGMPDVPPPDPAALLAQDLLDLTARVGARVEEDPFGNPVLLVALAITRRVDQGDLTEDAIAALIRHLRDAAFAGRAERLANYVGGVDQQANDAVLTGLAHTLLRPDPNDSPVRWAEYRALVERPRFAAVFTAHPTFSMPHPVGRALAEQASGRPGPTAASHRPPPITLPEEFAQANEAICQRARRD